MQKEIGTSGYHIFLPFIFFSLYEKTSFSLLFFFSLSFPSLHKTSLHQQKKMKSIMRTDFLFLFFSFLFFSFLSFSFFSFLFFSFLFFSFLFFSFLFFRWPFQKKSFATIIPWNGDISREKRWLRICPSLKNEINSWNGFWFCQKWNKKYQMVPKCDNLLVTSCSLALFCCLCCRSLVTCTRVYRSPCRSVGPSHFAFLAF